MMKIISTKVTVIIYILFLLRANTISAKDSINDYNKYDTFFTISDSVNSYSVSKSDALLDSLKTEYKKAILCYDINNLSIRKQVFSWNHSQSVIIFWMVSLIVLLGLIFSALQFYISMLTAKSKFRKDSKSSPGNEQLSEAQETTAPVQKSESPITSLKVSPTGIEVNSSVLGVIILVISLAFFYLYLIYVYPVKEYKLEEKSKTEMLPDK